jgi:hypothetical protein
MAIINGSLRAEQRRSQFRCIEAGRNYNPNWVARSQSLTDRNGFAPPHLVGRQCLAAIDSMLVLTRGNP